MCFHKLDFLFYLDLLITDLMSCIILDEGAEESGDSGDSADSEESRSSADEDEREERRKERRNHMPYTHPRGKEKEGVAFGMEVGLECLYLCDCCRF